VTHYFGWLCALVFLLLTGCAQLKVAVEPGACCQGQPVTEFKLGGRVSVKTESQQYSGSLSWHRQGGDETLLLSGPLGQGAVEIRRQGGLLVLQTADGQTVTDANDERLMERALGISLPLSGLVWWLSALPAPTSEFGAATGPDGRLVSLEQDGWRIEYSRYREIYGRWLPGRIFASRGELQFRLVVDDWTAP
jgi:outer membrane lipoprotein LolB